MNKTYELSPKEKMYRSFQNKHTEEKPVVCPYTFLVEADHWQELTGLPIWKHYEWLYSEPEERVRLHQLFRKELPFDVIQPFQRSWFAPGKKEREAVKIIHKGDSHYIYNRLTDNYKKIPDNIHNAGSGFHANEEQKVYTKRDIDKMVKIKKAREIIDEGRLDYAKKVIEMYNEDYFIISGGIINTFYGCQEYVGLSNLFKMLYDTPDLITYLSNRIMEQNIEKIRALSMIGGDAIYIDDATATNDMISLDFYEKFSLPYMKEQVSEIKSNGLKAIVIYFGGIADRIEQILSIKPDGLIMETSMKGYVNDLESIGKQIDDRCCLFGNINPISIVEKGTEKELYNEVKQQYEIGTMHGRFITSTGSPITPNTSVARIQKFIEIGHQL